MPDRPRFRSPRADGPTADEAEVRSQVRPPADRRYNGAMGRLLAGSLALVLAPGCAGKATPVAPPTPQQDEPLITAVAAPPAMRVREATPAAFTDPERRKKIEATLPAVRELVARIVEGDRLVGLAIGVVVDGDLVLGEGFGARHVESGGAIDTRTTFRIGSITKVFTAMAALHLAERGRIDLDAPAAELLPELDALVYPSADARRITVRDLITHTAGLPRDPDLPPLSRDKPTSRAALMQAIDGLALVRPPGLVHEYSNLGFSLLGHVVAAASDRPYHDAIDAAILAPLGMQDTVWEPAAVAPERLASGHVIRDGRAVVQPPTQHGCRRSTISRASSRSSSPPGRRARTRRTRRCRARRDARRTGSRPTADSWPAPDRPSWWRAECGAPTTGSGSGSRCRTGASTRTSSVTTERSTDTTRRSGCCRTRGSG
jgi:CubicO group peptidase (beta-lactamase class C family)